MEYTTDRLVSICKSNEERSKEKQWLVKIPPKRFIILLFSSFHSCFLLGIMAHHFSPNIKKKIISRFNEKDENLDQYFDYNISNLSYYTSKLKLHRQASLSVQHILIDLNDIEPGFFEKERYLEHIMMDLVENVNTVFLSYHCSNVENDDTKTETCVGIMKDGHIIIRSWPDSRTCILDLLISDTRPILSIVQYIRSLFISKEVDHPAIMKWAYKLRGSEWENYPSHYTEKGNLGKMLSAKDIEFKEEVISFKTKYQDIHIYDTIDPRVISASSKKKSLATNENGSSYEENNTQFFQPTRSIFLNGILQSSSRGDEAYHESLVHPGMFTHESPRNVAIIGGGEGATLREVLKHNTVEKVVMLDVDSNVVKLSREYLPSWNDCSNIINSTSSCFDDPRVELIQENAVDRFFHKLTKYNGTQIQFDVIIVDALDPKGSEVFVNNGLLWDRNFIKNLNSMLADYGVIIMQLGRAPKVKNSNEELSRNSKVSEILSSLEHVGMESLHQYESFHEGFFDPWSYLVACESLSCRRRWYSNSAVKDIDIYERMTGTYSGESPLLYVDGASMTSIQRPHKIFEIAYCRMIPTPIDCKVLSTHLTLPNVPMTSLEARQSSIGKNAGRGVYTKKDIKKGSMIAFEKAHIFVQLEPDLMEIIQDHFDVLGDQSGSYSVYAYMYGYGFETHFYSEDEESYYVDASLLTFVNHGCNSTSNIADIYEDFYCSRPPCLNLNEQSLTKDDVSKFVDLSKSGSSPVTLRHIELFSSLDIAARDITADEEIFQNYVTYEKTEKLIINTASDLKSMCSGRDTGEVSRYESGKTLYATE